MPRTKRLRILATRLENFAPISRRRLERRALRSRTTPSLSQPQARVSLGNSRGSNPTAPVLVGQCLPASVLATTRARVDAKGTMISGRGQVDSRYEERLRAFVEGKRLARLARGVRDRQGAFCDACGSTLPRTLFGLRDVSTGRYFFVGQNCLGWLMARGSVARARYAQRAKTAYELEMKTRLNGSNVDVSASPQASRSSGGVTDQRTVIRRTVLIMQTNGYCTASVRLAEGSRTTTARAIESHTSRSWVRHDGGFVLLAEPRPPRRALIPCTLNSHRRGLACLRDRQHLQLRDARQKRIGDG